MKYNYFYKCNFLLYSLFAFYNFLLVFWYKYFNKSIRTRLSHQEFINIDFFQMGGIFYKGKIRENFIDLNRFRCFSYIFVFLKNKNDGLRKSNNKNI